MRSPDQAAPFPTWEGHVSLNSLDPHPTELLRDPRADATAATRGGGAGGGSDTPPLGLGHLRDNPERSRSTAKAQAGPALAQRPRGQHDGPAGQHPHHRGGGPPARRQPQEAQARGACCVRGPHRPPPDTTRQAAGAGQRGRAGFRTPVPPPRTARRRGGVAGGPPRAGREERVPFTMNGRPSPVAARSQPGRAQHHHIDQGEHPRSKVGQSATASPEASEQISLAIPPAPGKGRQTTRQRRGTPDTHGAEPAGVGLSQPPQVPAAGSAQRRDTPHRLPRRPQVGQRPGPGAAPGVGTLERMREQQAHGPQKAAQAGAGPASRVTERPEAHHAFPRPNLSSDKSPEESVSAITWWPKIPTPSERYTSPGDRRSSHRPRRRTREPATRTSVPKIATIAARHGAPRALWSTPGHTPELRRVRGVLPATRATQGPARISRARLGSVFGRPLVRPGHTRERRPARCDLSGRTRAHGALSDSPRGLVYKRSRQRDGSRARGPLPGTRGTGQDGPRLPTGTGGKNSAAASDGQDARGPATGPGRTPLASRPKPGGSPRVAGQASGAAACWSTNPGSPTPASGPKAQRQPLPT